MDDLRRAKAYRLRAEEARTAAYSVSHQLNRATLLRIAHDYDLMAKSMARKPKGVAGRKSSTERPGS
jgi:hypothetical protein